MSWRSARFHGSCLCAGVLAWGLSTAWVVAEEERVQPVRPQGQEPSAPGSASQSKDGVPIGLPAGEGSAPRGPAAAETVDLPEVPGGPGVKGVAIEAGLKAPADPPAQEPLLRLAPESVVVRRGVEAAFILEGSPELLGKAGGQYRLEDLAGREVASGALAGVAVQKAEDGKWRILVSTRRAFPGLHRLTLTLLVGDAQRLERQVEIRISDSPAWDRWIALVHSPYEEDRFAALAALGVQGSLAYHLHARRLGQLRAAGVPFYVENVAHRFFSRYHMEPGLWEGVLKAVQANPDSNQPLQREPSLCASAFLQEFTRTLEEHARFYRDDGPLFYSLAAEPSWTRLGAAFDFDFHPEAVAEYRRWLRREVYGTVGALNAAWETSFKDWEELVPMTTDEARQRLVRGQFNLAPWVEFRVFQDDWFARLFKQGGEQLRRSDPQARVGLTGALGPFPFGGWDWARLAESLDVVEAYDIGGARQLWRDLAPGKPALAVIPVAGNDAALQRARRQLWQTALEGFSRGVVLWDELPGSPQPPPPTGVAKAPSPTAGGAPGAGKRVLLDEAGAPSVVAQALAPTLRELAGPLGMLLRNCAPALPQVGLVYSPESVRVHGLLELQQLHGERWLAAWGADTAAERRESPQLRLRLSWIKLLGDLGLPWRFVSTAEIERGLLRQKAAGLKVLVFPRTIALGDVVLEEVRNFGGQGGTLLADASFGRFDEKGRRRKDPLLDTLCGLDSTEEPLLAGTVNPLESIQDASEQWPQQLLSAEELKELPPVFSDRLAWRGPPPAQRFEYRKSPVLVRKPLGAGQMLYLNLNLDGYLLWRLAAEPGRARATVKLLRKLVFAPLLDDSAIDWQKTELPWGTEVLSLAVGSAAPAGGAPPEGFRPGELRVLALRRNLQERLHELGAAGESNQALERSQAFRLALKGSTWVGDLLADRPLAQVQELKGRLDPVTPSLYVLSPRPVGELQLQGPGTVRLGQEALLRLRRAPGAQPGPSAPGVYQLRVCKPGGQEMPRYGGLLFAPDGSCGWELPLALNESPGRWTLRLRDLLRGEEHAVEMELQP